MSFIVQEFRKDKKRMMYVCARPGYYRKADGTFGRDGSPSPEWTEKREHAFEFPTHRAAAIVRNKCVSATINEL